MYSVCHEWLIWKLYSFCVLESNNSTFIFYFFFGNTRHFIHIISSNYHFSPLVGGIYLILHMTKLRQREHIYLVKDQIPQEWQREYLNLGLIFLKIILLPPLRHNSQPRLAVAGNVLVELPSRTEQAAMCPLHCWLAVCLLQKAFQLIRLILVPLLATFFFFVF